MITLKEALRLCRIDDDEVVHLCDRIEDMPMWSWPMTGRETKNKYDLKRTMVTAIFPYFCCGEYEGFAFVVDNPNKEK